MHSADELRRTLRNIDGRNYKSYRDIRGAFDFGDFELYLDHIQGDPFAAPSRVRVLVPMEVANIPAALFSNRVRRIAFEDFAARRVREAIQSRGDTRRGSGKSGEIRVDAGGQEVLERTAVVIEPDFVEVRLQVGLPAAGRRVLGREAESLLCDDVLEIADRALSWSRAPQKLARQFVECVENWQHLQAQLEPLGLVAFVADGSLLARESGASDRPLASNGVPFESPDPLRVQLELANPIPAEGGIRRTLSGMGVRAGVTLIAGGGYHGKSTLLRALERAVYPHVPGDGREWVVSAPGLVKIRAEDGRRVERADIAAFIGDLPQGRSTREFSSEDASGSTSQAASIVEAVEAGATGLLLDEDSSATNFMVRDARMAALVAKEHEPITPFVDRVRELYETLGVSTVLVMGGCGDYFDVADCVIVMREFRPHEATGRAREIAAQHGTPRVRENCVPMSLFAERVPLPQSVDPSRGRREVKIDAKSTDLIQFGRNDIELRGVEQLVDPSQTRAIGFAILLALDRFIDGEAPLHRVLDRLDELFDRSGLDPLDPHHEPGQHPGNFARPRRFEIAAAINRLRSVRMGSVDRRSH